MFTTYSDKYRPQTTLEKITMVQPTTRPVVVNKGVFSMKGRQVTIRKAWLLIIVGNIQE